MKIYLKEAEDILATCPIGYYCGTRIPLRLDAKGNTTYIDLLKPEITVSFQNIQESAEALEDESRKEEVVRCLLYHEVGHAILTTSDQKLFPITDINNIFEDERLETMLATYFLDVNFKENVKRLCHWEERCAVPPIDAMDAFFRVVRFRVGPKEYVDRVNTIIAQYPMTAINGDPDYWKQYVNAIQWLYNDIAKDFEKHSEEYTHKFSSDINNKDDVSDGIKDEKSGKVKDVFQKKIADNTKTRINTLLNKMAICQQPSPYTPDFMRIIEAFNRKNKGGTAIQTYSGVINPRLVGREDFRIFERSSTNRGTNTFGKVHLNLFLDESGSYAGNAPETNKILLALADVERRNPNFTFDVCFCGEGERKVDRNHRVMVIHYENYLDDKIFEIFKSMQEPSAYNYNIVMFDGDANSSEGGSNKNFAAFNVANCTIISDPANARAIETYCPAARRIYERNNYPAMIAKHVMEALQFAFR